MKIPRKQSDILLKTYLKYDVFVKSLTDEQLEDSVLLLKNTVMIFYDIDEVAFNELPYTVVMDLYQIVENIIKKEVNLIPIFKHNDIEYGINPDFNDMTLAELIDCDTDDVVKQICILYRPIIKRKKDKYIVKKYDADIEIYDELKETLTLDIYLGFISFFLRISRSLVNYTQKYLMETVITPEQKKLLEPNGLGTLGYTY